jgi:hypothetical protein
MKIININTLFSDVFDYLNLKLSVIKIILILLMLLFYLCLIYDLIDKIYIKMFVEFFQIYS